MFQKQAHRQERISLLEEKAIALTRQFRKFIDQLKSLDHTANFSLILEQYMPLYKETMDFLNTVYAARNKAYQEKKQEHLATISNPYYWNLFIQISRYNQFFNDIQINPVQHPAITIYDGAQKHYHLFRKTLLENGIGGINHLVLKQPAVLTMTVHVEVDNIFTDIHQKNDQYYYHLPPDPEGFENMHASLGWEMGKSIASNFFALPTLGEGQDAWFKPIDRDRHAKEVFRRKKAIQKIDAGQVLTKDDKNCLYKGEYYRYASPIKFGLSTAKPPPDFHITHIGHGSEFIVLNQGNIPLHICVNPIHDDVDTWITRNTEAAFGLANYPAVNVVLLTDFGRDHCSTSTLKALFDKAGVLFIVPQGCGKILESAGLQHISIVELASFNAQIDITLCDLIGNKSTYRIHGFPANHVCQRSREKPYSAMSMSYLLPNLITKEVMLIASQSAKLWDTHLTQLRDWCRHRQFHIQVACIPMGPDRPRKMLSDQHQSTLDVLLMQAAFSQINGVADDISLTPHPCYIWGNNQGCFRQGLISYRDVDATLNRILALLKALKNIKLAFITEDLLKNYLIYHFMDTFEQKGLMDLVNAWKEISPQTTTVALFNYLVANVHIAIPGSQRDYNRLAFTFNYQNLLLNSRPDMVDYNQGTVAACEYFLLHLDPANYNTQTFNGRQLIHDLFVLYLKRQRNSWFTEDKSEKIRQFMEQNIPKNVLEKALGLLYDQLFPKNDEARRNEGHAQTAFILFAGLLHFPDFRDSMAKRHQILRDSVCQPSSDKKPENLFIK